jgi:hypothetical protein
LIGAALITPTNMDRGGADDAIARLKEAIAATPIGPAAPGAFFAQWSTVGRHLLTEWADDLGTCLARAAALFDVAAEDGLGGGGVLPMEECLWRLDSAIDKLAALLALGIGTPVLQPRRDGVLFRPNPKLLVAKLKSMTSTISAAGHLAQVADSLAKHRAREVRNEVSHALSQVGGTRPFCHISVLEREAQRNAGYTAHSHYGRRELWAADDIRPETIWRRAQEEARDLHAKVVEAALLAATVLRELPSMAAPPKAIFDRDARRYSLDPPA